MAQAVKIRLKIRRQDGPNTLPYWQEFELPYQKGHNVLSLLMEIQKNPLDISGCKIAPPAWEACCLEEVCGTCSMVINGRARQACTALIDQLEQPITLEPLDKFPVIRDLVVDRSRMFDNLKKVKAWIDVDGYYNLGPGPRQDPQQALRRYSLSTCMSCGVCLQVCPQVSLDNKFMGAAPINQVCLFNSHPVGAYKAPERLEALMGEGGIADCGNAQNCVEACPKHIPLTESIAEAGRQVTLYALKKYLGL
mgnify:CR=1 FL=1